MRKYRSKTVKGVVHTACFFFLKRPLRSYLEVPPKTNFYIDYKSLPVIVII